MSCPVRGVESCHDCHHGIDAVGACGSQLALLYAASLTGTPSISALLELHQNYPLLPLHGTSIVLACHKVVSSQIVTCSSGACLLPEGIFSLVVQDVVTALWDFALFCEFIL